MQENVEATLTIQVSSHCSSVRSYAYCGVSVGYIRCIHVGLTLLII